MANYGKNADSAYTSILKAGRLLPISRTVKVFDNITGAQISSDEQSGTIAGVVFSKVKTPQYESFGEKFVEAMIRGAARVITAAAKNAPFVPQAGDVVSFDGSSWEVYGTRDLNPAGIPILYTLGVVKK
jgi:hypothetical protein